MRRKAQARNPWPQLSVADTRIEINPSGILLLDQTNLPIPPPLLELFLARDCGDRVVVDFQTRPICRRRIALQTRQLPRSGVLRRAEQYCRLCRDTACRISCSPACRHTWPLQTSMVMDSGPASCGASRNDEGGSRCLFHFTTISTAWSEFSRTVAFGPLTRSFRLRDFVAPRNDGLCGTPSRTRRLRILPNLSMDISLAAYGGRVSISPQQPHREI
jgi:hypothetical protein